MNFCCFIYLFGWVQVLKQSKLNGVCLILKFDLFRIKLADDTQTKRQTYRFSLLIFLYLVCNLIPHFIYLIFFRHYVFSQPLEVRCFRWMHISAFLSKCVFVYIKQTKHGPSIRTLAKRAAGHQKYAYRYRITGHLVLNSNPVYYNEVKTLPLPTTYNCQEPHTPKTAPRKFVWVVCLKLH